jgi:hypothetical protein
VVRTTHNLEGRAALEARTSTESRPKPSRESSRFSIVGMMDALFSLSDNAGSIR